MLFPTLFFIMYFLPAALALYWACHFSISGQNFCLLILSLLFYAWGEPLHLVPMVILIVGNHLLGLRLVDANNPAYIGRIVKIAAVLNIGTLLAMRYGSHILWYVAGLTGLPQFNIYWSAPLGISFFALQAFVYIFDIARGKALPSRNILNTGLFIAFLPTVLFGPILNYRDMEPQFRARPFSLARMGVGGERLVGGLAKLLLLAVPLYNISTDVFGMSMQGAYVPVLLAWLGLIALGLYYYMLLSGFADMAIGIGGLFGFTLPENFRYPYLAHTVTEFCNRWNITMFRWFYV
ncbi:MAG: hypothetical protein LUC93_01745, partial [Planctomycetaceae bacterium]|nr:hypothetical protein [Planctomycetaceae bacterium]